MTGPRLTEQEFAVLPSKKQLVVLYRTMVEDAEEGRAVRQEVNRLRWWFRGLTVSDAALWVAIGYIFLKTVG